MLPELFNMPAFTIPVGILSSALIGYVVVALKSRSQQSEFASLRAQGDMAQDQLKNELEKIHLQAQIDDARRDAKAALALDEAKAIALATQQALSDQEKQLATATALATDAHKASNGATTEMLRVEQELRTKIITVETAARTAENTATAALAASKELSQRDVDMLKSQLATANEKISVLTEQLRSANEKIAALTLQLGAMAQQAVAPAQAPSATPQPVVGTESGQPVPVTVVP